ncbi:MAG: bifunctional precorrin-2 dehydrogenase/sirohydrochlorin ferrochelatase [Candidatus Dormibacteria bacterium]
MGYYGVFLSLGGRDCLVVGGGSSAEEKALGLLEAGARVTVCWETFGAGLRALGARGRVELLTTGFSADLLDRRFLVIDASADEATGITVSNAARERGVLVNVLDRPSLCDFIAPALIRHGPLQVAISTSGRSPFLASHIREILGVVLGPEWGELVELTGQLRDRLRADRVPRASQSEIYARIPGSAALEMLRHGSHDEARALVQACGTNQNRMQKPKDDESTPL